MPQGSARLNVLETLRAAAPWQRLRGRMGQGDGRVRIDPSDFRVTRHQQRTRTLTIFAVDASGSSALNRLAEAKGAVELLLADCYVRRAQRRGETPTVVMLTDGRANVGNNGMGGREAAHADALRASRQLRQSQLAVLFVDTSPRPNPLAQALASAMDARYIPLPFASAAALSTIVTAANSGRAPR
jgi:magnesium chelatase subunit D